MKESRESLDRKKKEPFILDGICLKQKEKTLNTYFYSVSKNFGSLCTAPSHCRLKWRRKNLIIENLIGKQLSCCTTKNTVLSLLYLREEGLFQTHLVQC